MSSTYSTLNATSDRVHDGCPHDNHINSSLSTRKAFQASRSTKLSVLASCLTLVSVSGLTVTQVAAQTIQMDQLTMHVAAPQPTGFINPDGSLNNSDAVEMLSGVTGNIWSWCYASATGCTTGCGGSSVPSACRTPEFAASNLVFRIESQYQCLPDQKKAAWLDNLSLFLYNFGTVTNNQNDPNWYSSEGPDSNPTSLFIANDVVPFASALDWPSNNTKRPWITPWYRQQTSSSQIPYGGIDRAQEWFTQFLDAFEVAMDTSSVTELKFRRPKFVAFDTEQLALDLSQNGVYQLQRMPEDYRWSHLVVPGSNGKTMAQLWADEKLAFAGSPFSMLCSNATCDIGDQLDAEFSFIHPNATPSQQAKVLKNRRIGMWYSRICKMANNAAMKEAFYDPITNRWPETRVFNYGDVAYEHRKPIGDERFEWRMDRTNNSSGQCNYEFSNKPLLGVRNVFTFPTNYVSCPVGQNEDFIYLRDTAQFPQFLFDVQTGQNFRPDRFGFDPASYKNNGVDIPGTDVCPVYYGAWTGGRDSLSNAPIDPNYPWLGWPNPPSHPMKGEQSKYWELGRRNMRDIADAMFFMDLDPTTTQQEKLAPERVVPWISMVGTATFPYDGDNDRPGDPAEELDILSYFADMYAMKVQDALIFTGDSVIGNGCIDSTTYRTNWTKTTETKRRVYASQLQYVDSSPIRGTPLNAASVSKLRYIIPNASNHPDTWDVRSVSVLESLPNDEELDPDDDTGQSDYSQQVIVKLQFHVDPSVYSKIKSASAGASNYPHIHLEVYSESAEYEYASPIIGWIQTIEYDSSYNDSSRLFDYEGSDQGTLQNIGYLRNDHGFTFYTPDYSTRRIFKSPVSSIDRMLDVNNNVKIRLIFKRYHSEPFTIKFDRVQLVIGKTQNAPIPPNEPSYVISPGDVNFDGTLNEVDIAVFMEDYQHNAVAADLDDNGVIDMEDVASFVDSFSLP